MREYEKIVAAIVSAAPERKLVSRVRLQKIAYLLEEMGFSTGLDFSYHHYGPFSHELDLAILDAKALGLIVEEFGHRQSDGASYSIFKFIGDSVEGVPGGLEAALFHARIQRFAKTNVTVLELAATAHWLNVHENVLDWKNEIVRRKGAKTQGGRLEKALELLCELNLPPVVQSDSCSSGCVLMN